MTDHPSDLRGPVPPTVDGLQPIPGTAIHPPPKGFDPTQALLDDRLVAAGLLYRAGSRFLQASAPLLAAGTTYYLFLAVISGVTLAYGAIALMGSDWLAQWLTEALENAFPGLVGENGISPESIRGYGTTASVLGLVVLAFAGTGAVHAAGQSLHVIYGAAKDPTNFVVARIRMLGQLLILGPLVLLSLVPSLLVTSLAQPIVEWLGLQSSLARWLLLFATATVSLLLNFLIISLLLGHLGGIRPPKRAHRVGAASGAVMVEVLKFATASIISWSLSKPRYGAFAVPITLMLVLFLISSALYISASLTAAVALQQSQRPSR